MMLRGLACEGRRRCQKHHDHDRDQRSQFNPHLTRRFSAVCSVFNDVESNLGVFDHAVETRLLNSLICTNTSLPPPCGEIKPQPSVRLNHFKRPARHARSLRYYSGEPAPAGTCGTSARRKMVSPRRNLLWRAKLADKPCRNPWQLQHSVIELPLTMIVRGAQLGRPMMRKFDHDDSVAGPDRCFGGDCADGWFGFA
jgi:hypothetical protein